MFDFNMLNKYAQLCLTRNSYLNALQSDSNLYSKYIAAKKEYESINPIFYFSWKIIALIILSIAIIFAVKFANIKDTYHSITRKSPWELILIVCSVAFLFVFILLIVSFFSRISDVRKYKKYKKIIPDVISNIEKNEKIVNDISQEIASYNLLPVCYWHLGNVIVQYILNGRADTIKEAINLYEFEFRQDMQFRAQMDALNNINNQLVSNGVVNALGMAMISSSIIFK